MATIVKTQEEVSREVLLIAKIVELQKENEALRQTVRNLVEVVETQVGGGDLDDPNKLLNP